MGDTIPVDEIDAQPSRTTDLPKRTYRQAVNNVYKNPENAPDYDEIEHILNEWQTANLDVWSEWQEVLESRDNNILRQTDDGIVLTVEWDAMEAEVDAVTRNTDLLDEDNERHRDLFRSLHTELSTHHSDVEPRHSSSNQLLYISLNTEGQA